MQIEEIIKLTCALHSVVAGFPRNEPLAKATKKKSLNVLAGYCLLKSEIDLTFEQKERAEQKILENIIVLENYFKLAEAMEWVRAENFWVLGRHYNEIKEEVVSSRTNKGNIGKAPVLRVKKENLVALQKPIKEKKEILFSGLKKARHKRIVQEIEKRGEMQVKDLEQVLPNITKRTIRRDMGYLMDLGLIERNGDKSATSYKMKM